MVEASYDVAVGAVYPEFSHKIHVVPHVEPHVDWIKGVGVDHGIQNPTTAIFATKLPTGEFYVYREYYSKGKLISEHAANLKVHITPQHRANFIDPSCRKRLENTGITIIDEYARHGLPLAPGNSDMQTGINTIKELLQVDRERENPITKRKGCPKLLVSMECKNFIREMMSYRWEELKTGIGDSNLMEKPHKYNDHTCDAARYLFTDFVLSSFTSVYTPKPKARVNPQSVPKHEGVVVMQDGTLRYSISHLAQQADKVYNGRKVSWMTV